MAISTTNTTNSGSGTLSSLGLGSGLDANSIVTKLVELERQPITDLQDRATKLQTKISAFGQVQSAVSTFRDAARTLANPEIWAATTATSSDPSAVTFSTSTGAVTGSYSVGVTSLASSQSVVNNTRLASATSTLGSGTLTFETGTWTGTSFGAKSGSSPVSVNIAPTDTLEGIRDKINGAGAGVTAKIVTDSGGARLVMTSTNTGAASGFRVTASDSDGENLDGNGISALAFDLNPDPLFTTTGSTRGQEAKDAVATINGVEVTSTTNTFTDVLAGISFKVGKTTTSDADVTVAQDNEAIKKAVNDFATAYSAMSTLLRTNTKYDDATKTAGTLQGDSTAVSTLNQFRAIIGSNSSASSVFGTLSSIGVEIQTDGTVKVNNTKLTNAMGKLSEVKKLFADASNGIGTRLRTLGDSLLGFDGPLTTRTAGLNKAVTDNQKRQDELDARVALYEKRLRAQYTALDKTMSGLTGQSSYVTQMITNWNKSA